MKNTKMSIQVQKLKYLSDITLIHTKTE